MLGLEFFSANVKRPPASETEVGGRGRSVAPARAELVQLHHVTARGGSGQEWLDELLSSFDVLGGEDGGKPRSAFAATSLNQCEDRLGHRTPLLSVTVRQRAVTADITCRRQVDRFNHRV